MVRWLRGLSPRAVVSAGTCFDDGPYGCSPASPTVTLPDRTGCTGWGQNQVDQPILWFDGGSLSDLPAFSGGFGGRTTCPTCELVFFQALWLGGIVAGRHNQCLCILFKLSGTNGTSSTNPYGTGVSRWATLGPLHTRVAPSMMPAGSRYHRPRAVIRCAQSDGRRDAVVTVIDIRPVVFTLPYDKETQFMWMEGTACLDY
jgi:hypothetical protein